jgi:TrmH family RNA methyltransferase
MVAIEISMRSAGPCDDRHMTEVITSSQNAQLKLVRKLQRRRVREQEGLFVVEGEDLVLAGLETGARAKVLLVDAERVPPIDPDLVPCPLLHVQPKLLAEASGMAHLPRVIGIFQLPAARDLAEVLDARAATGKTGPWIALDGLGDPGNVGTVLRTVAAFGGGGVVTLPDTADPFGGKAARASMGSCFRVPVARLDASDVDVAAELDAVRAAVPALRVVALDAEGDTELWDAPLDATTIVVVGGERDGISDAARSRADVIARIPQDPNVESVNAGVAASIALYDWKRRSGG